MGWIKINHVVYDELMKDSKILQVLEDAGVSDWEGYTEAMEKVIRDPGVSHVV
jgi:hypothetical protein